MPKFKASSSFDKNYLFLQPRSGLSYSAVGSSSFLFFFLQTFAFWPWYFSFVRGLRFILGDPSYLGTPRTWGPLVPGDSLYLGTPHTWGPLIPGDPSYMGTPHTWGPLIPGDPSYLGTPHTWGPLFPGDPSYLWAHHNWGSLVLFFSSGDSCFFSHISHANWNIY